MTDQIIDDTNQDVIENEEPVEVESSVEETPVVENEAPVEVDSSVEETPAVEVDSTQAEGDEGIIVINSDITTTAHWYVVHTYAGHEKKVAVTLKQRAETGGYTDRVFKVFIPHQQKIVINEGKKRSVDERLFPGYVIVLMDMTDDTWLLVRSTRGVTGFVGMGSTPTPVAEHEVKALMRYATMEAPKFEAKFSVGDSVKIMEGPFKDILGKVEQVNEDQGKVKVLITSFGREVPVELDLEQVQSI